MSSHHYTAGVRGIRQVSFDPWTLSLGVRVSGLALWWWRRWNYTLDTPESWVACHRDYSSAFHSSAVIIKQHNSKTVHVWRYKVFLYKSHAMALN